MSKQIKAYVSDNTYQFITSLAEYTGYSISNLIAIAINTPLAFKEILESYHNYYMGGK